MKEKKEEEEEEHRHGNTWYGGDCYTLYYILLLFSYRKTNFVQIRNGKLNKKNLRATNYNQKMYWNELM